MNGGQPEGRRERARRRGAGWLTGAGRSTHLGVAVALVALAPACSRTEAPPAPTAAAPSNSTTLPRERPDVTTPPRPSAAAPPVKTAEQLTTHDGQTVSVFGVYERLGGPKPAGGGGEPAGVRLADGTLVLLGIPGTPSGARPASEVGEFAGERVVATGIVVSVCPPDASGGPSASDPCFPTGAHVTTQAFHEMVWGD